MPTPASTRRSGRKPPPRRAKVHTSAKEASAPANAAEDSPSPSAPPVLAPSTIAETAPSDAPLEMPSR